MSGTRDWGRGKRADQFLTVIYQVARHCRRLLWVGRRRTQATLRRGNRVSRQVRLKLVGLLQSKLATGRAWDLKEGFQYFWRIKSVHWAGTFLDYWTNRALRTRLEPMKKVARMLRKHQPLLLNWFKARGEVASGAVEGLHNKLRVVTRRSYRFRSYQVMELALYHNLGRLPEPESTHRFC
jgi:transposase